MSSPLKMYAAGALYPSEYSIVALCTARSHKEAKAVFWAGSDRLREECDWRYVDMRVKREPGGDKYIGKLKFAEPHVVEDVAVQRELGWFHDGDNNCADCGLYTMDGEFPVCEHCDCCEGCGHAEDCPERKPC